MSNYRSPIRTVQVSLAAGELDPLFRMRTDSPTLEAGARLMRNMLIKVTGAATRRPGTTCRAVLNARSRLVEFEYDANEKYICAFRDNGLEIYDKYGRLVESFSTRTGTVPWESLDNDFWEMTMVQKGDVMIIAHTTFKMTRLRRTGLNSFVLEPLEFSTDTGAAVLNQPYVKYYPRHYTMALSDISFTAASEPDVTVTCSHAIFTTAWVGERMRIYNKEIQLTKYVNSKQMKCRVKQRVETELDIAPFRYSEGSKEIEVTHVLHGLSNGATVVISGAQDENGLGKSKLNGPQTITVLDEDRYRFVYGGQDSPNESIDGGGVNITIATTSPTSRWTEQVWSQRRGWPGAICLHENRLWLGGSSGNPTFLAASAVGQYYDFNVREGLDDESIQGTIATLSRIQYMVSGRVLQIFTESSEAVVETRQGEPATPGTLKVVTQTYYGTNRYGMPRIFDGGTLFIQKNAKNIRELRYDFNTDAHASVPVSMLASHMISSPHDLGVLQGTGTRPEQYAFIVNGNQNVPIFHSIVSEKMSAWTLMTIGRKPNGKTHSYAVAPIVDSVCCMGSDVFFSVRRGEGTSARPYKYYLERLELDPLKSLDADAAGAADPPVWLDCAFIWWYAGTRTSVQLPNTDDRYRDTYVTVMSQTSLFTARLYSDNSSKVNFPKALKGPIVVGFDHGVTLQPNPPDTAMQDGPMTGQTRRVLSTQIHLNASASAAVNGREILGYAVGDDPSAGRPLFTGKRKVRHLGYGIDPVVSLTQPVPGPLTVLGMVQEVSI